MNADMIDPTRSSSETEKGQENASLVVLTPDLLSGRYKEIADAAQTTRSHLSRVLRGEVKRPSMQMAGKILHALCNVLEIEMSEDEFRVYLEDRQREARERGKKDMRPHVVKIREMKGRGVPIREIERRMREDGYKRGVNRQTIASVV